MPKPPEIQLSDSAKERLIAQLEEMADQAFEFRNTSGWNDLHAGYWRQYLCVPDAEIKTWPWEGCSNLYLPMTQAIVDALLAQEYDAMLSNDPTVKVVPQEGTDEDDARDLTHYYGDYYYKQIIPLKTWGADWLKVNAVDGTSAVKVRQQTEFRVVREQRIIEISEPKFETLSIGDAYREDIPTFAPPRIEIIEDARIERMDGTVADVCDMERIYVAPDSGPSFDWPDCRWYFQEQSLTWEDLLERKKAGYDVPDTLKAFLFEEQTGASDTVKLEKEDLNASRRERTLCVREYYMRWPLPSKYQKSYEDEYGRRQKGTIDQESDDEEGYWEEIVVTYCPDARHILRLRPLWRICPDGLRPHIPMHYDRTPRYFYGLGIPAKLRQLQAALNSSHNQMVDYGSLCNLPFLFYNPATMGLVPELFSIRPGAMIPTMDPRGVNQVRLQSDPQYQLMQQQQIQSFAERVGAISDVQLGRNPSTPNAPRTFRGMAIQIQQANIIFSRLVTMHAESFVKLFRKVHAFRRRWAPAEEIYNVINRETGAMRRGRMRRKAYDANIDFDFVLNPSRQADAQLNMQLFEMASQIPQIQGNPEAMRRLMRDTWEALGKKNFDRIWPEGMNALATPPSPGTPKPLPAPGPPAAPMGGPGPMMTMPEAAAAGGIPTDMATIMGGAMPMPEGII